MRSPGVFVPRGFFMLFCYVLSGHTLLPPFSHDFISVFCLFNHMAGVGLCQSQPHLHIFPSRRAFTFFKDELPFFNSEHSSIFRIDFNCCFYHNETNQQFCERFIGSCPCLHSFTVPFAVRRIIMELRKLNYEYPFLPLERRKELMRERSVSSVSPAYDKADYLYTGNGSHRIDMAGRPFSEEIIVTQEMLYEPNWDHAPLPPDLSGVIDTIRDAVMAGDPDTADAIIDKAQREMGYDKLMNMDKEIVYPIGSPHVHKAFSLDMTAEPTDVTNYIRFLDMMTGAVTTHFETADGVFEYRATPAFKGDYNIFTFNAPAGKLNLTLSLSLPGGPNMYGIPTMVGAEHEAELSPEEFVIRWKYAPEKGRKGYAAFLRFIPKGGMLTQDGMTVTVKDANRLTVLAKAVPYREHYEYGDEAADLAAFRAIVPDEDAVLVENLGILGEKMNRSQITIGTPEDAYLSGEELLAKCNSVYELYPAMMDKLYDMGRFYQIIDTGKIPPMWGQHNINTNLQVCAGNNTGLFDEMDCYFRYYETKFDDFRTNAKRLFGARGLLASVHCDIDNGLYYHFSRTYPHYCFTGVLGWVLNEFWGYYLCTEDREFLKDRLVPALEETALFFMDYSERRGDDGHRLFVPSFSPEDPTPNPDYVTVTCADRHATRINSVMDIAICREVVENLISSYKILGIKEDEIAGYEQFLSELPVYLTDPDGGLKEWASDIIEENYNHRHVSHHYDLWPGRAVTVDKNADVAEAIRISNRKRGQQDDSAHGIIHRTFSAIRLKDMEEAVQNLSQLICHGFVRKNLSTAHFPYRGQFPDLQGAMPAILLEMCVYSEPGMIEFLPCLPDYYKTGELKGIWLYTFVKMESLVWDENGFIAEIVSEKDQTIVLKNRCNFLLSANGIAFSTTDGTVTLKKGEKVTVKGVRT